MGGIGGAFKKAKKKTGGLDKKLGLKKGTTGGALAGAAFNDPLTGAVAGSEGENLKKFVNDKLGSAGRAEGNRGKEKEQAAESKMDESAALIEALKAQSDQLAASSKEAWDQYKTNLSKYEQFYGPDSEVGKFLQTQASASPERMAEAAGEARADVEGGLALSEQQRQEKLQSLGVDPSDPAAQAGARGMSVLGAGMRAGAANQARQQVREQATQTGLGLTQLGQSGYLNPSVGAMGLQGQGAAGGLIGQGAALFNQQAGIENQQAGMEFAREQGAKNRDPMMSGANAFTTSFGSKLGSNLAGKYGGLVLANRGGKVPDEDDVDPVDRIPAELVPDEYVMTAKATKHLGTGVLDRLVQAAEEGKDIRVSIGKGLAPRRVAGQKPVHVAAGGLISPETMQPPLGAVRNPTMTQAAQGGIVHRVAAAMTNRGLR